MSILIIKQYVKSQISVRLKPILSLARQIQIFSKRQNEDLTLNLEGAVFSWYLPHLHSLSSNVAAELSGLINTLT